MKSVLAVTAAFAALASAYTPPTNATYGSLLTPNQGDPVTTGQTFTVTWQPLQPAEGVTVSLVLCNGPSSNCVTQPNAIAEGIPAAAGSYSWNVPCSLPAGTQSTASGYGMLIIVDGTGQFQYSTQFSVLTGSSCSSSTTTTTTASSSSTTSSSSKSSSTTTSPSGSTTSTTSYWYGWSTTSTVPSSTTKVITPTPQPESSTTYTMTTHSSMATSTVSGSTTVASPSSTTSPKPFTGGAALPTAFANAAGVMGAAMLGMMAL